MSTPTDNPEAGREAGPEGVSSPGAEGVSSPEAEGASPPAEDASPPVLRVVTPDASPEEVAALVAVFAAMGGGEPPAPRRRPEWNAPARLVRQAPPAGPGAWRASGLPGG